MPSAGHQPVIAIIGGGFTGAAIAYHLDKLAGANGRPEIVVVEPRPLLGKGLAYSTSDPEHRINVPASRMSLEPDVPNHFEAWLAASDILSDDPQAVLVDGRQFPRREVFGRYVSEALAPAIVQGRIRHRRALVEKVDRRGLRYRLSLSTGASLDADLLVIATTHPPPTPPAIFRQALEGHAGFIDDTTRPGALDSVKPRDRVLIVGTGLTMADIVASLEARGFLGSITAFSRRGQLSAPYPAHFTEPVGDFLGDPSTTVRSLVRSVREQVAEAEGRGLPWQVVFDTLRLQGYGIWRVLPVAEQRRLVRHLRAFWDARRFRIAPQMHDVLDKLRVDGRLTTLSATAQAVRPEAAGIQVKLALRSPRQFLDVSADKIIIATGPAHGNLLSTVPYLKSLAEAGLLQYDAVGLGLAANDRGQAVGRHGIACETLLVGGPLARGTFGELMGLPEVSRYAVTIAREIAFWLMNAGREDNQLLQLRAG